jgi:pyruvate-formate lyase-activating enzyme
MELAEIIGLRPVTGAGLLVCVTRRCPLSCAHCSTDSGPRGAEPDAGALLRFTATFTPADRPDVIMATGGEPLLRPRLVTEVAGLAAAAGTRTAVLTGAAFARGGRYPAPIRQVVRSIAHFSVSTDAWHERQVGRADVFRLLRRVLDDGTATSLHVTGTGPDDPYLASLTAAVTAAFGHRVPMLVSEVRPLGRAAAWAAPAAWPATGRPGPEPCALAAWPVITFDGSITACCNQDVVDGRERPAHLAAGHIATSSWPQVREHCQSSPLLRLVRTAGPRYGAATGSPGQAGYCAACQALPSGGPEADRWHALAASEAGALLDRESGRLQARHGAAGFVRRHGCARYADLVSPAGQPAGHGVRGAG